MYFHYGSVDGHQMGKPSPILGVVYRVNVGLGKLALVDNLFLSWVHILFDLARFVSSALGEIPETINDRHISD